jgi:integrase
MTSSLTPADITRLADELLARTQPAPVPLDRFEREILAYYAAKNRAKGTILKLRQALREVRALPDIRTVQDLTFDAIVRFLASRTASHSITTISLLSSLRAACSFAVDVGYLRASPFTGRRTKLFPRRGPRRREKRHHSREEIARVLRLLRSEAESAADGLDSWRSGRLYGLFAVLVYTGMRRNEALHLLVRDVDLFGRVARIVPRIRLKTEDSARTVPLPPELAVILAGWLPRTGSDWVFPKLSRNGPWTGGCPGYRPLHQIQKAARRAGVEGMTLQTCRHSYTTHARFFGLNRGMRSAVLGHTSERTQDEYLEDDLDDLRDAVQGISFAG